MNRWKKTRSSTRIRIMPIIAETWTHWTIVSTTHKVNSIVKEMWGPKWRERLITPHKGEVKRLLETNHWVQTETTVLTTSMPKSRKEAAQRRTSRNDFPTPPQWSISFQACEAVLTPMKLPVTTSYQCHSPRQKGKRRSAAFGTFQPYVPDCLDQFDRY